MKNYAKNQKQHLLALKQKRKQLQQERIDALKTVVETSPADPSQVLQYISETKTMPHHQLAKSDIILNKFENGEQLDVTQVAMDSEANIKLSPPTQPITINEKRFTIPIPAQRTKSLTFIRTTKVPEASELNVSRLMMSAATRILESAATELDIDGSEFTFLIPNPRHATYVMLDDYEMTYAVPDAFNFVYKTYYNERTKTQFVVAEDYFLYAICTLHYSHLRQRDGSFVIPFEDFYDCTDSLNFPQFQVALEFVASVSYESNFIYSSQGTSMTNKTSGAKPAYGFHSGLNPKHYTDLFLMNFEGVCMLGFGLFSGLINCSITGYQTEFLPVTDSSMFLFSPGSPIFTTHSGYELGQTDGHRLFIPMNHIDATFSTYVGYDAKIKRLQLQDLDLPIGIARQLYYQINDSVSRLEMTFPCNFSPKIVDITLYSTTNGDTFVTLAWRIPQLVNAWELKKLTIALSRAGKPCDLMYGFIEGQLSPTGLTEIQSTALESFILLLGDANLMFTSDPGKYVILATAEYGKLRRILQRELVGNFPIVYFTPSTFDSNNYLKRAFHPLTSDAVSSPHCWLEKFAALFGNMDLTWFFRATYWRSTFTFRDLRRLLLSKLCRGMSGSQVFTYHDAPHLCSINLLKKGINSSSHLKKFQTQTQNPPKLHHDRIAAKLYDVLYSRAIEHPGSEFIQLASRVEEFNLTIPFTVAMGKNPKIAIGSDTTRQYKNAETGATINQSALSRHLADCIKERLFVV